MAAAALLPFTVLRLRLCRGNLLYGRGGGGSHTAPSVIRLCTKLSTLIVLSNTTALEVIVCVSNSSQRARGCGGRRGSSEVRGAACGALSGFPVHAEDQEGWRAVLAAGGGVGWTSAGAGLKACVAGSLVSLTGFRTPPRRPLQNRVLVKRALMVPRGEPCRLPASQSS